MKTWFITGATSGIGLALVTAALERGDNVVAVARRPSILNELVERYPRQFMALAADVRDQASVGAAVDRTLKAFDRIDVVANNAGYGLFGAVEEVTDAQARAVFDTNVFGVLNVLRATLPLLRRQRSGHVLQGSSLYGQSAHAGVGLLAATKYAVEGLTDALVHELAPLGIAVTLVEPGPTATAFLANLDVAKPVADYNGTVRAAEEAIGRMPPEAFSSPADIARGVMEAVDAGDPPLRLALGAAGADAMRAALRQRLNDLDTWAAVTADVG